MSWDFLHPGRLWLLLAVGLVVALYAASLARRRQHAVKFTNIELLDSVVPRRPPWRRHVIAVTMLLGLTVGVLGLAQPYHEIRERDKQSVIMIALDVSLSMSANDISPSRLAVAKEQAKEFLAQVDPSISVGLISFAEHATVRVNPTLDHSKLNAAIDRLSLAEGTGIGEAIETGTETVLGELGLSPDGSDRTGTGAGTGSTRGTDGSGTRSANGGPPAAIVVMTDGETSEGLLPTDAGADVAKQAGIPVYGIVFGTLGGTVIDRNTGRPVPVPVKYDELDSAASITGGQSYKADSKDALSSSYSDIVKRLDPALKAPEPKRSELTLQYLAIALLLLAAAFVGGAWLLGGFL
jgi:Ca-activated chloride channel family protein